MNRSGKPGIFASGETQLLRRERFRRGISFVVARETASTAGCDEGRTAIWFRDLKMKARQFSTVCREKNLSEAIL